MRSITRSFVAGRLIFSSALYFFYCSQTVAQEANLPACPSDNSRAWNLCIGERVFRDGTKYSGEFKDNYASGEGKIIWIDGTFYVGSVQRSRPQGKGMLTSSSGEQISGDWKDGKLNGVGNQIWPNGEKYIG